MARVGDIYKGGDFLVTEDLGGQLLTGVIKSAEVRTIGDTDKIVISFENHEKVWPCNATNSKTLAKLFDSDETDNWIGRTVILRPDVTNFGGKQVGCIRVDVVAMGAANSAVDVSDMVDESETHETASA